MTDDRLSGDHVRGKTLSEGLGNVWGKPVSIMGRRAFVKALGAGLLLTMAAPVLSSCESFGEAVTGERTISDHVGRELEIPTPSK